jgi:hypothetical protein
MVGIDTVFGETRGSKVNLDGLDAGVKDICIIRVEECILINKFG